MIELLVMRHGDAQWTSPDKDRQLSIQGVGEVERAAMQLPLFDEAWVSPFKRAQQTWKIIQQQRALTLPAREEYGLTPDAPLSDLLTKLEQIGVSRLLLVGHNPLFSHLVQTLSGEQNVALGTANIARLQGDFAAPNCMTLKDLL